MITVLLKAHSVHSIYHTLKLNIDEEDFTSPIVGQTWDIEFSSGFIRCKIIKKEFRDSSAVFYSCNTHPVEFFDENGQKVTDIWVTQSNGHQLLILPE